MNSSRESGESGKTSVIVTLGQIENQGYTLMQGKPWKQATEDAILRICRRRGTKVFDFDSLRQELPQIVKETKTTGKTPENSLSKYMQDLRNEGQIEFVDNQGTYQLIDDDLVARCSR